MSSYFDDPITVAVDAQGAPRSILDVPNGLACGCFCPAPGCRAQLVARNRGAKMQPHFAHRAGSSCEWALESSVALLAKAVIERQGAFAFPDWHVDVARFALPRTLSVSLVETLELEGWGAPILRLTCDDDGRSVQRLVVFAWHDLERAQDALRAAGADVVTVRLNELYRAWKFECERHSNKAEFTRLLQAEEEIGRVVAEDLPQKRWLVNAAWSAANEAFQREQERIRQQQAEALRKQQEKIQAEREAREWEEARRALAKQRERGRVEQARQQRADARLAALEDFCTCNGLTLRKVAGAGRLVDCPLYGGKNAVGRTDRGCCTCDALVKDFGTHIACAAGDE